MAEKLGGVNGVSDAKLGKSSKGAGVRISGELESKTLTENPNLIGGVAEEIKVLFDESSSESVTSRIEIENVDLACARISNVHNVSRNRVVEMSTQDEEWRSTKSVICIVERLLQGKFGLNDEEEANNFEEWDANMIPERQSWHRDVENPISVNEIAVNEAENATISSSRDRDSGSNEVLQDDKLAIVVANDDTDGVLIPKTRTLLDVNENEGEYYLSDLVWGKVKSHPWWPGQIFLPSAASDKAQAYFKRESYLIAYFGDQTFAWNEAVNIKPFRSFFSEMEKQSAGDRFCSGVENALDELTRRVEFGLSCLCLSPELRDEINKEVISNPGIREESSVTTGGDYLSTVASFVPYELMQNLNLCAESSKMNENRLRFTTLKAQLLAFDRWRWRFNSQRPILEEFGVLWDGDIEFNADKTRLSSDKLVPRNADDVPSRKRKLAIESSIPRKQIRLVDVKDEENPSSLRECRKMKLLPSKIPSVDVIISNLTLVAKSHSQGYRIAGTPVHQFLCRFRDSVCIEKHKSRKRKGTRGTEDYSYSKDRVLFGEKPQPDSSGLCSEKDDIKREDDPNTKMVLEERNALNLHFTDSRVEKMVKLPLEAVTNT